MFKLTNAVSLCFIVTAASHRSQPCRFTVVNQATAHVLKTSLALGTNAMWRGFIQQIQEIQPDWNFVSTCASMPTNWSLLAGNGSHRPGQWSVNKGYCWSETCSKVLQVRSYFIWPYFSKLRPFVLNHQFISAFFVWIIGTQFCNLCYKKKSCTHWRVPDMTFC